MKTVHNYYYNCSKDYLSSISTHLFSEVIEVIEQLPKRSTQTEINNDLVWLLADKGWRYDTISNGARLSPPEGLSVSADAVKRVTQELPRNLCQTTTTVDAKWHADYAKVFDGKLVQIEAQFGKVESMFKDFCGFKMAFAERRLALGIEIVISEPTKYFSHRLNAIGGMANFGIAKSTLSLIGLECPIWLIGF
jgi:hypothetical protein